MKRIRCVPLLAFSNVPPTRMAEIILRRKCEAPLLQLVAENDKSSRPWIKQVVPRILEAACVQLRQAISRATAPEPPDAATLETLIAQIMEPRSLASAVSALLDVNCLLVVLDEAQRRIDGRDRLPRRELNAALVPFTSTCIPDSAFARECWCGSWILEGEPSCVFCGDSPPRGRTTRVWKRGPSVEQQLDPMIAAWRDLEQRTDELRDRGMQIPSGCDPHVFIAQVESGATTGEEVQ